MIETTKKKVEIQALFQLFKGDNSQKCKNYSKLFSGTFINFEFITGPKPVQIFNF